MTILNEQRAVLDKGDFGSMSGALMIGEEMYQALVEIHAIALYGANKTSDDESEALFDRIRALIERMSE